MKYLFTVLTVLFTMSCWGQPIQRNPATTNITPPYVAGTNGFSSGQRLTNSTIGYLTNVTELVVTLEAFGAIGDKKTANHCFATNGSAVITSTNASFVAGDVGKVFKLSFGGTNGLQDWTSVISSVNNSTQVTLANPPVYSVTNKSGIYGTDNTVAIQAALNYVTNVDDNITFLVSRRYIVNGPLQSVGNWSNNYNAQLICPYVTGTDTPFTRPNRSQVIRFKGMSPQLGGSAVSDDFTDADYGSEIVSTLTDGPDGLTRASVFTFNGPTAQMSGNSQHYLVNHVTVVFEDLKIRGAYNNNLTLINAGGTPNGPAFYRCLIDGGFYQLAYPAPASVPIPWRTNTIGVRFSQLNNDNRLPVYDTIFSYFNTLVFVGENCSFHNCYFWSATNVFDLSCGGGNPTTFSGANVIAHIKNVFVNPETFIDLDVNNINIQQDYITNWCIVRNVADRIGGTIDYFDSSALQNQGTTNQGYVSGTTTRLVVRKKNNLYGEAVVSQALNFGGNTGFLNGPHNGVRKSFAFRFPQFGSTNYNASFMSVDAIFANQSLLNLGYENISGSGNLRGVEQIRFFTAPDVNSAPVLAWAINESRDLISANGITGSAADRKNISSDTWPMGTNYATGISSTNYIYKGTTNVTGNTVAGQMKLIHNGVTYYIDLKLP